MTSGTRGRDGIPPRGDGTLAGPVTARDPVRSVTGGGHEPHRPADRGPVPFLLDPLLPFAHVENDRRAATP